MFTVAILHQATVKLHNIIAQRVSNFCAQPQTGTYSSKEAQGRIGEGLGKDWGRIGEGLARDWRGLARIGEDWGEEGVGKGK